MCLLFSGNATWQYESFQLQTTFPLYPETADEVDMYNKKLHDGYEVTKKNDEKSRPFVNNFSYISAVVVAPHHE